MKKKKSLHLCCLTPSPCMPVASSHLQLLTSLRSFSDESAKQRQLTSGKSKILPQTFYRTFYETSMTLCSRVSKDTHAKHRERPDLKIEPGNAFQAIGKRSLEDAITKEGIERHLKWNKKRDPSQFISTFNELSRSSRQQLVLKV